MLQLALLADGMPQRPGSSDQRVLFFGDQHLPQRAESLGIESASIMGQRQLPMNFAALAWLNLGALKHQIAEQADVLHAWSIGTFTLAAMAFHHLPRVLTLTTLPGSRAIRWLRYLLKDGRSPAHVLAVSSTLRTELLRQGLPEAQVHLLRPGIDQSRLAFRQRRHVREKLGLDDQASLIVLPMDRREQAINRAALTAGLAMEGLASRDVEARLLISPNHAEASRIREVFRSLDNSNRLIEHSIANDLWQVLPASDIALLGDPDHSPLASIWSMAAGVPIVAPATYAACELLEDHHSALLAPPDRRDVLARRITTLATDPQLCWQLKDTARHEAYSFFSRRQYVDRLQRVYSQLVEGVAVDVPAMESTGGLRFMGRG